MDVQELQIIKNKHDIVGNSPGLNRAIEMAVQIAPTELTVLITGESGVGKEAIPQIIHQLSRRKNGRYLAVNCGAIPEGTINAELFGHEKGAFTGAIGERKGYFEEANGGTLFLDEIGELPKETQAMLLRVLQSGEYMKVGSSKVEKTDVRVVAATNVDLSYAVATGKFRRDLYYRLNAVQIAVPSLAERKDDIYLLFRKFSSDFSEKYSLRKISLSHEAITLLTSYRWPGNIRQLKNIAEAVTAMEAPSAAPGAERVEVDSHTLAQYMPREDDTLIPATVGSGGGSGMSETDKQMFVKAILDLKNEVDALRARLDGISQPAAAQPRILEVRKEDFAPEGEDFSELESPQLSIRKASDDLIEKALLRHGGKVKPAAAELGISERTIYRKLAEKKTK